LIIDLIDVIAHVQGVLAVSGNFESGDIADYALMLRFAMMKPIVKVCRGGFIMAITVQQISPVGHLPLILGMLRKLEVATIIDGLLPPNPVHVLSGGRGVEALILAILDGHHALYKVGSRLLSSSLGWTAPP
jgi:hypothetical protein